MTDLFTWIGEHFAAMVASVFIPLQIWLAKTLLKVTQTIYGANGNDGMAEAVQRLTALVSEHATVDLRITMAQQHADEAKQAVDDLTERIVGGFNDLRTRVAGLEAKRR
jgi:hypothetical protein